MTFFGSFLALCLVTGFGLAVLRAADRWRGKSHEAGPGGIDGESPTRSAFEVLALGFLCGVSATGLLGQLWIALGFRLTRGAWAGFGAIALAATLWAIVSERSRLAERWMRLRSNPAAILPGSPLAGAFLLLAIVAVLWSFRQATALPIIGWDALSFWYLKTKILLYHGTVFTPDFLAPDRIHAHTDYPVLINIVEAGICQAVGRYREDPLKSFLALWELACLVVAGAGMARRRGATLGYAALALLALLPALTDYNTTGAVSGYRDAPLALLILATATLWSDYVGTSRRPARDTAALVLLLALLIGTKREGTVWALFLGGAALLALPRHSPPSSSSSKQVTNNKYTITSSQFHALFFLVIVPFSLMLPWFLIRAQLPYPRSENFTEVMLSQSWDITSQRATLVLGEFINELFLRAQRWGVLWWVFVAVALWRRRAWNTPERLLALLVVGGWLMAALGFVYTPWGESLTHLAVSIDRLVLQGALLALWLTVLNCTAPLRPNP